MDCVRVTVTLNWAVFDGEWGRDIHIQQSRVFFNKWLKNNYLIGRFSTWMDVT